MTNRTARSAAWASAGLLLVASTAAVGADLTRTESWNGNASIDAEDYTTIGTLNISSNEVGAGAVVYAGFMSARWLKTDGSCSEPRTGNPFHRETGIRVVGPSAQVEMVAPGTYTSTVNTRAVTTTYGWTNTNVQSGAPVAGTFQPSSGVLRDALFDTSPVGNWLFQAEDTGAADPLCLYSYNLTLSTTLPPIPRPGSGYLVNEGSQISLNGNASSDDVAIVLHQWDCGSGDFANGVSRTCSYTDQGTQTARLRVRDNRGIERTAATTVTVVNVAPRITALDVPIAINEGELASMSGSASDPGDDVVSYTWSFGDGSTAPGSSANHFYGDDGVLTVALTASDEDGGVSTATRTITVNNVPPRLVSIDTGSPSEGIPAVMLAEGADVPLDTVSYAWNFGDGSTGTGSFVAHTYADEGSYNLTLILSDEDGGQTRVARTVTVADIAPVIQRVDVEVGPEGSVTTFTASVDKAASDTLTYRWDFGDATPPVVGANLASVGHRYAAEGEYIAQLTVTDDDGSSSVFEVVVPVDNAPPVIATFVAADSDEGLQAGLSAVATDPGGDPLSYRWDFGDGSEVVSGFDLREPDHVYGDNGTYTVRLTVEDDAGASASETRQIRVRNVDPVIASIVATEAREGALVDLEVTASDVPEDPLTYTWDFGDGSAPVSAGATVVHTWANDGVYTVTVTARDDDGGSTTEVLDVVVSNQEPVIVGLSAGPGVEGQASVLSAVVTDAGADDLTYTWNFGDGSPNDVGVDLTSVTHTWPDNGNYVVTLVVSDGLATVSEQTTVAVSNVDPVISGVDVQAGTEGQATVFTATASDVRADPLTYRWDFGDGSPAVTIDGDGSVEHIFSASGSAVVTLTVTDGDGGSSSTTVPVDIANGPPSIAALDVPDGTEGAELVFTALALDGSDDTLTYVWDFGDGSAAVSGVDLTDVAHTYADDGLYTVTLVVSDGDGASVDESAEVVIANVSPNIASLTGDLLLDEASVGAWSALATDPGDDILTYSWSLGDGGQPREGVDLTDITAAYADDQTYTLTLTVSDEDGGSTAASLTVVVSAVAPVIDGLADLPVVDEGSPVALSASASEVTGALLDWVWTFGDGSAPVQGPALRSVDHTYGDEGTYRVNVTVTDDDDLSDSAGIDVVVVNVAPSLQGNTPVVAAFEGQAFDFQPTVREPGDDVLTWTLVDGPDGAVVDPSTGAVSWMPTYEQSMVGTADFSISVDDGDGGSDQLDWTVTVFFADSDDDGLADEWESENGFDPNDPSDGELDPDSDGRPNVLEFLTNTDPNVYEGPGIPQPVSPRDGETALDSRPTLAWTDAEHPLGEGVVYEAEVYADSDLTDLITVVQSQQDALTGRVSEVLPENAVVYWRVRGADAYVASEWSMVVDFFVDGISEAPPTPEPVFPVDGEWLTTTPPTFQWNASLDPDRDAVVYDLEVFDVDDAVVASVVDVAELTWESTVPLDEDVDYTWSVRAVDADGEMSAWSVPEPFFYTTSDVAPQGLAWIYPLDFAQVTTPSPTLTLTQATDPERTEVMTIIELDSIPSYDSGSGWSTELANTDVGELAWDLAADGIALPERTLMYARAQAVDANDIASPWVETTLRLGGADVAPTVPDLVSPSPNAVVGASETVSFVFGNSTDADGDGIVYTLVVTADAELTQGIASEMNLAETAEGLLTVDVDLGALGPGLYYWSAEATDSTGLSSGFAASEAFELGGGGPLVEPRRCGCSAGSAGSAAWLMVPLFVMGLRRRRYAMR